MDWAIDRLGRLVQAQAARQVLAFGFSCPTCREPVRLRAGMERRAHFAHYNYRAKPECENYHPSTYVGAPVGSPAAPEPITIASRRIATRGGIFLQRSDYGRFSLYLRLPRLGKEGGEGKLTIQSGLGVRSFSAAQLLKPQFARVSLQVPLVTAYGTEEMAEVAAATEQDTSVFRTTNNFFRTGDSGRLLAWKEPLEWGETYRIVTQYPLTRIPIGLGVELVAQPGIGGGWYIYEVHLPSQPGDRDTSETELRRFLDRDIRFGTSHVYVVDPLPHHIEPDGTYIYPDPPRRVLLHFAGTADLQLEGDGHFQSSLAPSQHGNWVTIDGIGPGEFSVSIGGQRQINLRTDECDLFTPAGVQMIVGDRVWELFDSRLLDAIAKMAAPITIETYSRRVADFVHADPLCWVRSGTQYVAEKSFPLPEIFAGNFGSIVVPKGDLTLPPDVAEGAASPELIARRAWLTGMLIRIGDLEALSQVQQLWLRPAEMGPASVVKRHPWLRPYIACTMRNGDSR